MTVDDDDDVDHHDDEYDVRRGQTSVVETW